MSAAQKLAPCGEDAYRFLRMLADDAPLTFQTFGEGKSKAQPNLTRVLHGTLAQHAATLVSLNARGAGVFVMVNEGDGKGRKATSAQRVRALFVDLDCAPLEPVESAALPAHCIIETSPGRWHAYWRVSDCPLDKFTPLQKALAARFNGDASVSDLPRVMRLPGFEHRKREAFTSHIVILCDRAPYTLAELVQAFDLHEPASSPTTARRTLPAQILEGQRNDTLLSLAAGLVRKGYDAQGVNDRLQRMNAERCTPPLCASEVDTIASRAVGYGSNGFTILPHHLLDSPQWKALPPPAHDVILTAFRRYDGINNGNIALTWADFDGLPGFANKHTFYRHRRRAVASGILLPTHEGGNTQRGKKPDLFAIAECWLHDSPVSNLKPCASVENVHPYIDKQAVVAVAVPLVRNRRKTRKAA